MSRIWLPAGDDVTLALREQNLLVPWSKPTSPVRLISPFFEAGFGFGARIANSIVGESEIYGSHTSAVVTNSTFGYRASAYSGALSDSWYYNNGNENGYSIIVAFSNVVTFADTEVFALFRGVDGFTIDRRAADKDIRVQSGAGFSFLTTNDIADNGDLIVVGYTTNPNGSYLVIKNVTSGKLYSGESANSGVIANTSSLAQIQFSTDTTTNDFYLTLFGKGRCPNSLLDDVVLRGSFSSVLGPANDTPYLFSIPAPVGGTIPTLTFPGVTDITATSARPQVTLTY